MEENEKTWIDDLKEEIDTNIKPNNHKREITGAKLNTTLKDMVDEISENIPQSLGDLEGDSTHQTVTEKEKEDWSSGAAIFTEAQEFSDAQRLQAIANVSNQSADSNTGKMGYVVLQPEKSGDDTTKFAAQIANKPNTIFEIKDVFDLGGLSVNIPQGSVLRFNGGLITHGTLRGDLLYIDAPLTRIFGDDLTVRKTSAAQENSRNALSNEKIYLSWFGCEEGAGIDNSARIEKAITAGVTTIVVDGIYHISNPIDTKTRVFEGNGISNTKNYGFVANDDFTGTTVTISYGGSDHTLTPNGMFFHHFSNHPVFKNVFFNANKAAKYCIEHAVNTADNNDNYSNVDCHAVKIENALITGILQYGCERPIFNDVYVSGCNAGIIVTSREVDETNVIDFTGEKAGNPNLVNFTNVRVLYCNYGFVLYNNYNTSMYSCETGHNYLTGVYASNSLLTVDDFYTEGDGRCGAYLDDTLTLVEGSSVGLVPQALIDNDKDGFHSVTKAGFCNDYVYYRSPFVVVDTNLQISSFVTSEFPRGTKEGDVVVTVKKPNERTFSGVDCLILAFGGNVNIGTHKIFIGIAGTKFYANYILCAISNSNEYPTINVGYCTSGNSIYYGNMTNGAIGDFIEDGSNIKHYGVIGNIQHKENEPIIKLSEEGQLEEYHKGARLYRIADTTSESSSNNNRTKTFTTEQLQSYFGTKKQVMARFIAHVLSPISEKAQLGVKVIATTSGGLVVINDFNSSDVLNNVGYYDVIFPLTVDIDFEFTQCQITYKIPKDVSKVLLSDLYLYDMGDGLIDKPIPYKGDVPAIYSIDASALPSEITIDNQATSIENGMPYYCKLTASSSLLMEAINITMGGKDVTNFVLDKESQEIFIPAVSGDIRFGCMMFFKAVDDDCTIQMGYEGTAPSVSLQYKKDGDANWNNLVVGSTVVNLAENEVMLIKGVGNTAFAIDNNNYNSFSFGGNGNIEAYGDVTSLLNGKGGDNTLANNCFRRLFRHCAKLKKSPNLPSTNLGESCYYGMFDSTGLTESPILVAKIVAKNSYNSMFSGCSSLTKVTTYMTDIIAVNAISNWLLSVSASGDIYCEQSLQIPTGNSGIPSGWTRYNLDGTRWEDPNAE